MNTSPTPRGEIEKIVNSYAGDYPVNPEMIDDLLALLARERAAGREEVIEKVRDRFSPTEYIGRFTLMEFLDETRTSSDYKVT